MTITELVNKLIELGWYADWEVYASKDHIGNHDGLITVTAPAINDIPILFDTGLPVFQYNETHQTWEAMRHAEQRKIDWLEQVVSALDTEVRDLVEIALESLDTPTPQPQAQEATQ